MNFAEEAFEQLFPEKEKKFLLSAKFSGKFNDYNANIRMFNNNIRVNLSKKWRKVNKEITIGLIQSLLLRLFKEMQQT